MASLIPRKRRIFVSYRRVASPSLAHLIECKFQKYGIEAFVDTRAVDGAGPFPDRLRRAIERADVFVCLLGENTLDSKYVLEEIAHAEAHHKRMVPVFQEKHVLPNPIPNAAVEHLLRSDGVRINEIAGTNIDAELAQLANIIRRTVAVGSWWPLTAIVVLVLVAAAFFIPPLLSPPPNPTTAVAVVQTSAASAPSAPGVTDSVPPTNTPAPVATDTLQPTDTPPPPTATRTSSPTDTPPPTATVTLDPLQAAQATQTQAAANTLTALPTPTLTPSHTPTPTPNATETKAAFEATINAINTQAAVNAIATSWVTQGVRYEDNDRWTPVFQRIGEGANAVEMALVPPGCFTIGSEEGASDEANGNEVCFEAPFWIDRYEVSNGQYQQVTGQAPPSSFTGGDLPVETIDWYGARDYCAQRGARLPSEAEWEYAARGPSGLIYPYGNTFNTAITVDSADANTTQSVATMAENESWVGARHMSGNVWEWTSSIYTGYPYPQIGSADELSRNDINRTDVRRVLRGGSWISTSDGLRATNRSDNTPSNVLNNVGLRCALSY